MTSQGNGQPVVYQVSISGQIRAHLLQLRAQAVAEGKGLLFMAALWQILGRLAREPRDFGEHKFRLPALQLTMYQAAALPLIVHYGVHDDKPLVLISRFIVMS